MSAFRFPNLVLAIASTVIVGCAGPANNNDSTPDATTTVDQGTDTAVEGDVGSDVGIPDPDMGTPDFGPVIYPVLSESEPNTQPAQATSFTQPAVLTGNVNVDDDVFDWWEVDLAGPAILRLTIQQGDIGWVEVQSPLASKRGLIGGPGATREFFVPTGNRYKVGVLATEDNPVVDYRIEVTSYPVSPTPLTSTTVQGDLDDGNVDVYSWTAPGAGFTLVEVFGERDPTASGIDSFLFVYDDALDSYVSNDDAMSGGTKDSRIDFERRDGAEYLIAVDMYEPTDDDRRYELRVQAN